MMLRQSGRVRGLFYALTLIVLVGVFAVVAGASPPSPFAWGLRSGDIQNPVEQQSPLPWDPATNVVNTTGCNWDVDDQSHTDGAGDLTAGQIVSTSRCLIADGSSYPGPYANNKTVTGSALSAAGDLTLTLTSSQGGSWTATKVYYPSNHRWSYVVCTVDVTPGPYPEIAGSNGGHGIRVDYTLALAAAGKAKATAQLGIGHGGCP